MQEEGESIREKTDRRVVGEFRARFFDLSMPEKYKIELVYF
jgi:hypothetical protein